MKLVLLCYALYTCPKIGFQYIHTASKKFTYNWLQHTIVFSACCLFLTFYMLIVKSFRHSPADTIHIILACEGWHLRPGI